MSSNLSGTSGLFADGASPDSSTGDLGDTITSTGGDPVGKKRKSRGEGGSIDIKSTIDANSMECSDGQISGYRICGYEVEWALEPDSYDPSQNVSGVLLQDMSEFGEVGGCNGAQCSPEIYSYFFIEYQQVNNKSGKYGETLTLTASGGCSNVNVNVNLHLYGNKHAQWDKLAPLLNRLNSYRPKKEPVPGQFHSTGFPVMMVPVNSLEPRGPAPGSGQFIESGNWTILKPRLRDQSKWRELFYSNIPPDAHISIHCGARYFCCEEDELAVSPTRARMPHIPQEPDPVFDPPYYRTTQVAWTSQPVIPTTSIATSLTHRTYPSSNTSEQRFSTEFEHG